MHFRTFVEANTHSAFSVATNKNKGHPWIGCFAKLKPLTYQVALSPGFSAYQVAFSLDCCRYTLQSQTTNSLVCEGAFFHRAAPELVVARV